MAIRAPDTVMRLTMDASQHRKAMVQAGRDLSKFERETKLAAKAQDKLKADVLGVSRSTDTMTKSAGSAIGAIKGLAIGAAAAGLALKKLNDVFADGLRAEGIYRALPYSIDEASDALDGLVPKLTLATAASQAQALNLNFSKEQFTQLSKAAAIAGQTMGIDMKTAMDSLVAGIGRQSRMMLDNLGIIVDTNAAYAEHAKTLGKTATQLSDTEKKAAFTKEAIRQLNAIAESGTQVTRGLGAQWTRFTTALSNAATATKRFISTWTSEWSHAYDAEERRLKALEDRAAKLAIRTFNAGMTDIQKRGDALEAERKLASAKSMLEALQAGGKWSGGSGRSRGKRAAQTGAGPSHWAMGGASGAEGENPNAPKFGLVDMSQVAADQAADSDRAAIALIQKEAQAKKDLINLNRELDKSYTDLALGGLTNFASGMWGAIDAAVSGQQSFGAAMLSMAKSALMGIAQQATVKAIFQTAEGFATMFINPLQSAAHFTSAKTFGVAAVAAGAAGIALSAASAGGGGGASRTSAGAGGGMSYHSGGASRGGHRRESEPVIINIRYDRSDPHSMRMAQKQIRAEISGQRYTSTRTS